MYSSVWGLICCSALVYSSSSRVTRLLRLPMTRTTEPRSLASPSASSPSLASILPCPARIMSAMSSAATAPRVRAGSASSISMVRERCWWHLRQSPRARKSSMLRTVSRWDAIRWNSTGTSTWGPNRRAASESCVRFRIISRVSTPRRPRWATISITFLLSSGSVMSMATWKAVLRAATAFSFFGTLASPGATTLFTFFFTSTVFTLSHLVRPVSPESAPPSSSLELSESESLSHSSLSESLPLAFLALVLGLGLASESSLSESLSESLESLLLDEEDELSSSLSPSLSEPLPLSSALLSASSSDTTGFSRYSLSLSSNGLLFFRRSSFMRFRARPLALLIFFWPSLSLSVTSRKSSSSTRTRM
mmetsp:Transcript_51455/g.117055  ORF Transcript_51455/g.117055 Transcript_51455/m.117055 type:complete len:364 (-) Transcript_51455:455-1546(-)